MRQLTYYIATSFDGFVARPDGALDDFTFDGEHVQDLLTEYPETIPTHLRSHITVSDQNRHFDTVLMGRRTYEVGFTLGITSPYQHLDQYLFSTTLEESPDESVTLVNKDVVEAVRRLKAVEGLGIWLCGGPVLASALVDEIDTMIVKINPFLMGTGKTLFADALPRTNIRILDRRDYDNGFALVHCSLDR